MFLASIFIMVLPAFANEPALQARIDAAPAGSTLTVEKGDYAGGIVIRKPLTLVGVGEPVVRGAGNGKVVEIQADDVTVRGFVITGSGSNLFEDDAGIRITGNRATIADNRVEDSLHGIYLKKVKGARILNNIIRGKAALSAPERPASEEIVTDAPDLCATSLSINERGNGIHLWNSEGNVIEGNAITETRDGIYFSFTSNTEVRRNRIHGVRYGLHYMYSDNNTFVENVFADNAAGAAIMFSKGLLVRDNQFTANRGSRAYGMLLHSVDSTRLERNRIVGNTVGIRLENSNTNVLIGNEIASNYVGLRLTASSDSNRFSRNRFRGNMHPAELTGQSESNRWSAAGVGNDWGNTTVLDVNQDGIGDLPHREPDLLGQLRRPFPIAGLLSGSPALELLRFAHTRARLPQVQAIEDPAPVTPRFTP